MAAPVVETVRLEIEPEGETFGGADRLETVSLAVSLAVCCFFIHWL